MTFEEWYEANKEVLTTVELIEKLRRAWDEGSYRGYAKSINAYLEAYEDGWSNKEKFTSLSKN